MKVANVHQKQNKGKGTRSKRTKTEEEENKMEEDLVAEEKEPRFFCGVCLAQFTRRTRAPVSLNCGHVFCARCVPQMYKRGEGEEENQNNGAQLPPGVSKLLLQCGSCRAITYSKIGKMKKCVMLAELIEKEGEFVESDAEEEGQETGGGGGGAVPAPIGNQPEAGENPLEDLNVYYRHTALVEVREKIARAQEIANSLRTRRFPAAVTQSMRQVEAHRALVNEDVQELNEMPMHIFVVMITEMGKNVGNVIPKLLRLAADEEQQQQGGNHQGGQTMANGAGAGNNHPVGGAAVANGGGGRGGNNRRRRTIVPPANGGAVAAREENRNGNNRNNGNNVLRGRVQRNSRSSRGAAANRQEAGTGVHPVVAAQEENMRETRAMRRRRLAVQEEGAAAGGGSN